jgi:hypothetical protein
MRRITAIAASLVLLLALGGTADATTAPPGKSDPAVSPAPTSSPPQESPQQFGTQSEANQIVQGEERLGDDLTDEGTLRNHGIYWQGNYAGFWQAILWADGLLGASQVDCEFGANTAAATRIWQSWFPGLATDGVVGPQTRGKAGEFLAAAVSGANHNVEYVGTEGRRLYLFRNDRSDYWIWWNGLWRPLDYDWYPLPINGC